MKDKVNPRYKYRGWISKNGFPIFAIATEKQKSSKLSKIELQRGWHSLDTEKGFTILGHTFIIAIWQIYRK